MKSLAKPNDGARCEFRQPCISDKRALYPLMLQFMGLEISELDIIAQNECTNEVY